MINLVLIGMPGCGKTTISRRLHETLKIPLIDIDAYLEDNCTETIEEMFLKGEAYFRDQETRMTRRLATVHGTILSCGGGIVLREENMRLLSRNGRIYYLKRDIEKIMDEVDTSHRPLLKQGKQALYRLEKERSHLYERYADVIVDNNDSIETTVRTIQEDYQAWCQRV